MTGSKDEGLRHLSESDQDGMHRALLKSITIEDEGRMTTANEPSVAELKRYDLNGECYGESGYCREKLVTAADGEWVLYSAHAAIVTRLERRCAEMEKALRAAVSHTTLAAGQCQCCWAFMGDPHDEGCWVDAALKLLPPERANEGTKEDGQ